MTVAWLGVKAEVPDTVTTDVPLGDPEGLLAPDALLRRVPEGLAD